jgi:Bacteriocin-protection, YdeI or OmpD-Associated/Domain of unknown function (DUF1905)
MRFTTTVTQGNGNTTGIEIPAGVVEQLGSKNPKVTVAINGFSYRSSVASMGGTFMVGISAERRLAAGVKGGDIVEVDIELDTAKREVEIAPDVAAALSANPAAKAAFEKLSYSHQSRHVYAIDAAKKAETRERNIAKLIATLEGAD